jgi:DNA primase
MFFEQFFSNRGEDTTPNELGEVNVQCPFPHSDGLPSDKRNAWYNDEKRVFHCFACAAAERSKGMSEITFIAKLYNTTYDHAIQLSKLHSSAHLDGGLESSTEGLLKVPEYIEFLANRGITIDTIKKYQLGYNGEGITYPIILNGIHIENRTYYVNRTGDEPKIKGEKGGKALLFPYDHWVNDNRTTLLCAGENDTLLARQNGFNAVTSTLGEGSIPKLILNKFKDREVVICYDCDDAGKRSSKRMAYYLREAGAIVRVMNLGLSGEKDDKDITDFFITQNKSISAFTELFNTAGIFTEDEFVEQKNKEYPLINLWEVTDPSYHNKYISSRVSMMGQNETTYELTTELEWKCTDKVEGCKVCETCYMAKKSGSWSLSYGNLRDMLKLIEVKDDEKEKNMRKAIGLPPQCPRPNIKPLSIKTVTKAFLTPDVETESELSGYREITATSYIIQHKLEAGNKYRVFFKRYAHPKDQTTVLVVDKVEESDNAINTFKVTPEFKERLKEWQGHPKEVMEKRYRVLAQGLVGKYIPRDIYFAAELVYHSVLDLKFMGKMIKGHPEILIVGASRTGKSEIAKKLNNFYQLGNMTDAKTMTISGALGGADQTLGGFRIKWGIIPRNHRGMLILDEVSGLPKEVIKALTPVRSERIAKVEKIISGTAPAKTRMLWIGNPATDKNGNSKSVRDYAHGIQVCTELIGAHEDINRFDAIVLVADPPEYISPLNEDGSVPEEEQLPEELRELIRWCWSRTEGQVKFEDKLERYIEHKNNEMHKLFKSEVKILDVEGVQKIAKMATSVAACCFSATESGEEIYVKKEHVDWVVGFLYHLYDNDYFRLREYSYKQRQASETDPSNNVYVAGLMRNYPMLIGTLQESIEDMSNYDLQIISGVPKDDFSSVISGLVRSNNAKITKKGITPTPRLRQAIKENRKNYQNQTLTPLHEQGGFY